MSQKNLAVVVLVGEECPYIMMGPKLGKSLLLVSPETVVEFY